MNTNEAIIVSAIVLVTLWMALRSKSTNGSTASLFDLMQPTPFEPNPIPTPASQTTSDICRDYCAGRITFFMDPGCGCQRSIGI